MPEEMKVEINIADKSGITLTLKPQMTAKEFVGTVEWAWKFIKDETIRNDMKDIGSNPVVSTPIPVAAQSSGLHRSWSPESIAELVAFKKQGLSVREIAARINRSISSVGQRWSTLTPEQKAGALPSKEERPINGWTAWSKEEDVKLAGLYKQGVSISQISRELNRTYHGVHGRVYRLKSLGVIQ